MRFSIFKNKQDFDFITSQSMEENYVACTVDVKCKANDEIVIYKYAGVVSSVDHPIRKLPGTCKKLLKKVSKKGFSQLLREQADAWASIWEQADVEIEGDVATQQAIRFSIFHLFQSFSGINGWLGSGLHNTATNDGSKGIHWSMEIFCLPFFQATSASEAGIARNLLIHRYNHLAKAIENAAGMRFSDGAALYPLTTMNGEECSGSSWETVFEEIHRNSIVAYAIFNYIRWGGDSSFLAGYGLEILIALARFWSQRVHWSEPKNKYVINGAKGPNAYECNVNNNWHTNYLAGWCLRYTSQVVALMKQSDPGVYTAISQKINFVEEVELPRWQVVYENLYLPSDEMRGILLQQDDFLEKEQLSVDSLKAEERPLYQHWSWDKIVRSCFIEQADVLLGMYLFSENFELETIRRNFDFYEPKTVHESPLSFCTHAILAARLGYMDKALELMKKSTRLDLDDLKNETKNGLHITSMAGNWLIITQGFGGMKVKEDTLSFHPVLPPAWESYTFKIRWKECQMKVQVNRETTTVFNLSDQPLTLEVFGKKETIANLSDMSFSNTTT
jgi:maltose phosphorylase